MSRAIISITKQVSALRDAEGAEDSWFALPPEGDDSVNWTDFTVEVEGPATYAAGVADDSGARPSPFAGGLFRVNVTLNDNYPTEAPKILFQTRVWHPQVHPETGKPCVDFMTSQWRATCGLKDVLDIIRSLLSAPNKDDGVNSEACREIAESWESFDKHAAAETARYAKD